MARGETGRGRTGDAFPIRRAWPLLLVLALIVLGYALGLHRHLTFEALGAAQEPLRRWVAGHGVLAPLAYVLAYALAAILTFPGALVMTVAGGLLLGTAVGGAAAIAGASLGAALTFLAARHAFADWLAVKAAPFVARIRPGLERDGFSFLLVLRILPLLPFWVVNLAPALVGMRFGTFLLATVLGILPGSFIFASLGAGLGDVLAEGRRPDAAILLRPGVLLPLLGLAVLALLPVVWRRVTGRATPIAAGASSDPPS